MALDFVIGGTLFGRRPTGSNIDIPATSYGVGGTGGYPGYNVTTMMAGKPGASGVVIVEY
jgi:hypothetical protein